MTHLSSRQRRCLQALAEQGEWPATTGAFGWRGTIKVGEWVQDTQRILASLAALGLAADESTLTVGTRLLADGGALRGTARTRRYSITDKGRQVAAR